MAELFCTPLCKSSETMSAGDRPTVRPTAMYADCQLIKGGHVNNLYNTALWALVKIGRISAREAEEALKVMLPIL